MKKTKIISAVIGAVLLSSSILSCEKLKSSFNKESSDETQEELEAARAEAEAAKQEAEEAKKAAEAAKKDAEKARKAADAAKKDGEKARKAADAAKKEADSVKIVDSAWDFEKGEKASKNQTILSFGNDRGKPIESDITIQSDSGSGAKLVFVKQDAVPIKYNKGLQLNSVKAEGKVAIITVGKDCNLIITARGSTSIDSFNPATKLNSFSVNGKNIYKRTIADDNKIQTWKVQLKKGDNTISASGMKFISLVCE